MAFPKPTDSGEWASGPDADIQDPLPGQRALGWVAGEAPRAGTFNKLFNTLYQWAQYVSTYEDTLRAMPLTVTALWTYSAGVSITAGGLSVAGGLTVTTGGATVTAGGLTVSAGGAAVTGNSTVTGTLGVTSNMTVGGTLGVTGNTALEGTLGVTGAATVGSLNAGVGAISGGAVSGSTGTFTGAVTATGGTLTGVTLAGTITAGTWIGTSAGSPIISYATGWANSILPAVSPLQARLLPWGMLEFRGSAFGDLAVGSLTIATLPVGYRTTATRQAIVAINDDQIGRIFIDSSGGVTWNYVGTAPTSGTVTIHFDGVRVSL